MSTKIGMPPFLESLFYYTSVVGFWFLEFLLALKILADYLD